MSLSGHEQELIADLTIGMTELTATLTEFVETYRGPFFELRVSPMGETIDDPEDVPGGNTILEEIGWNPTYTTALEAVAEVDNLLYGHGLHRVLRERDIPPASPEELERRIEAFRAEGGIPFRNRPRYIISFQDDEAVEAVLSFKLGQAMLSEDRLRSLVADGIAVRTLDDDGEVVYRLADESADA